MTATIAQLDMQRKRLGMSVKSLAKHAGVGSATVNRLFSGKGSATLDTVEKVAAVLGCNFEVKGRRTADLRRQRAEQKAEKLAAQLQGTMALEAQAVDVLALQRIKDQIVTQLLKGSDRKLWED